MDKADTRASNAFPAVSSIGAGWELVANIGMNFNEQVPSLLHSAFSTPVSDVLDNAVVEKTKLPKLYAIHLPLYASKP